MSGLTFFEIVWMGFLGHVHASWCWAVKKRCRNQPKSTVSKIDDIRDRQSDRPTVYRPPLEPSLNKLASSNILKLLYSIIKSVLCFLWYLYMEAEHIVISRQKLNGKHCNMLWTLLQICDPICFMACCLAVACPVNLPGVSTVPIENGKCFYTLFLHVLLTVAI